MWTKEERAAYQKEYRQLNKSRLNEYKRNYVKKNIVKVKEYRKSYHQGNKIKLLEKARAACWRSWEERIDEAMEVYHVITFHRLKRIQDSKPFRKLVMNLKNEVHLKVA